MICELYNKMLDVESYVLDDDFGEETTHHNQDVPLDFFIAEMLMFALCVFIVFWWYLPLIKVGGWFYKKHLSHIGNIVFTCKRRD